MRGDVIDRVATAMRETSAAVIEPRFGALARGDVEEKSPDELVTVADRDAETLLTHRLTGILPGVPVIGEEACATDPGIMRAVDAERAWLLDPLDGTANFVAGSSDWAVLVALLAHGKTVASWMWRPAARAMYIAELGEGAYRDGERLHVTPRSGDEGCLRGAVLTRFLRPDLRVTVEKNSGRFAAVTSGRRCAGVEYPEIVDGGQDFVVFWRTLAWDHAPGVLFIEEAGGVAARPDGAKYLPSESGEGLVVAADPRTWSMARRILD